MGNDRVDGAADPVGLDGQLAAEAAIDEHAELDFCRAAEVEEGVERGADGAACPEDVIYEDDVLVLDGEGDLGFIEFVEAGADVVAVEGDVQLSIMDGIGGNQGPELLNDAVGEVNATRLYADEHSIVQFYMVFQQLVGQSLDGNGQLLFIQDDLQGEFFIKIG